MPMPEYDNQAPKPKRKGRQALLIIGIALLVVGLVVSMTGIWQLFAPGAQKPEQVEYQLPVKPASGEFGKQVPNWTDCGDGFECTDVRAPIDWSDTEGEEIRLRLVKHPATSGNPIGTLFVNPGGPGASGADFVRDSLDYAAGEPLQQNYDVIGWDPRGVGASSSVSCLSAKEMDDWLFGVSDSNSKPGSKKWIAEATDSSKWFGEKCLEGTGELLGHVDTDSTVRDLDMMREIIGDDQLNYLGYSYGTFIGARYAETFPEKVGRLVLDGVLSPSASEADVVREQTRGFESALRAYATACLGAKDCPLTGTVDEAMAQIGALIDGVDEKPLKGSDGRMFTSSTMLTAIVTPLYSESNWGYLNTLFETVADGNADVGLALADSYFGRQDGVYVDNSTEAFQAINCLDYPRDIDQARMKAEAAELERIAPTIGRFQGFGGVSCAGWPFEPVTDRGPIRAEGAAPIMVLGTTGDPATPFTWAEEFAKGLDQGVLVKFEGEGHTAYGKNACVNETVEKYLIDGTVPNSAVTCS